MNRVWNKRTAVDGRPAWWRQTVPLWAEGMTDGSTGPRSGFHTQLPPRRTPARSDGGNKESRLNKELAVQTWLSSGAVWLWDAWKGNMAHKRIRTKSTGRQINKHPLLEQCIPYYFCVIAFSFLGRPLTPTPHVPLLWTFILFPFDFFFYATCNYMKCKSKGKFL